MEIIRSFERLLMVSFPFRNGNRPECALGTLESGITHDDLDSFVCHGTNVAYEPLTCQGSVNPKTISRKDGV